MLKTAFGGYDKLKLLENIKKWLIGRKGPYDETSHTDATHMIMIVDDFEGIFPAFVGADENVQTRVEKIDENREQQVVEVYDLAIDIDKQLAEQRAYHI